MADVLAAPQHSKADSALRTLTAISIAHWLSHFHLFVLPMLFPFLKAQLGVGYIELGLALTVFGIVSGLTQAPIGYLADHYGARNVLLIGLCLGGFALMLLGLHLSYTSLIVCAALLGLANSVYHPCDYAILAAHMDEARMGRAFSIHTFAGFLGGVIAPSRDMLVRNAAPPGAAGRAFGIVSTGFNFSGILAPLLYGFIMDQHMPHWVFGASVVFMLMTVLLALVTDRKSQRPAEPAAVH